MTATPRQREELHELLLLRQEGDVSADAIRQIDELVQNDPDLLEMYVEYSRLFSDLRLGLTNDRIHVTLANLFDAEERSSDSAAGFSKHDIADYEANNTESEIIASPALPPSVFNSAMQGMIGFFSQEIPFSLLIATVITGLGLWGGSMIYVSHYHDQIAEKSKSPTPSIVETVFAKEIVGRITGTVDCQLQKGSRFKAQGSRIRNFQPLIPNSQSPVSLGDKFVLSSGLLEITYETGAKVVLQSPVTYEVDSAAGGLLSVGKLTARIEKREEGREESTGKVAGGQWLVASEENPKSQINKSQISNPLSPTPRPQSPAPMFTVRTPSAIVTDLGTEFGVEVDRSGATRSYVFKGRIEVASVNGGENSKPVQLHEKQSVVVDSSGKMELNKPVDRSRFVRRAEFNPFPGLINLAEGKLTFQETFHRDAAAFPAGYPTWFYNPHAVGGSDNTVATAIVRNGVLRLTREKTEISFSDTEIASIARQFSGRMLVSVDLGCDSINYGNSHIALRLGELVVAFHPGHYARDAKETMRGAFRVNDIVMNTDMGFVPDVDVLHHLYVYYDGRDAFQVCVIDGLYRTNVFRSKFTTPVLSGKKFSISIHRSGMESTGMFDNLRVIELPKENLSTASESGGSGKQK